MEKSTTGTISENDGRLTCECGFSFKHPVYPVYCKCGRFYAASNVVVDALASNQPGTELARIVKGDIELGPFHVNISFLGYKPKPGCNCESRIDLMNTWGVSGCIRNKDTIVRWLQDSAIREGVRLPRLVFSKMVDLAIHNASKPR